MPKRHINVRIDENLMVKIGDLVGRYPKVSTATVLETAAALFFSLPSKKQEESLRQYLLEGFKDGQEGTLKKKGAKKS